jgi:hypothetical protein
MRTAIGLLIGWLLAALLLVAHDGHLPEYLTGAISGSLLMLGVVAGAPAVRAVALQPAQSAGALPGRR